MRLTNVQELAITAIIGRYVGCEEFDKYFVGMTCGRLSHYGFAVYVHNEYYAHHIERYYLDIIPHAVRQITGIWPQHVSVLVKDYSKTGDVLKPYLTRAVK